MKEKQFNNSIRNFILAIFTVSILFLLLVFLFGPAIWEYVGQAVNYETYLKVLTPAIAFLSIIVTGAIAIYVMDSNHKKSVDIMMRNHKHSERMELEREERHFKKINKVFWRSFHHIDVILMGYNNYFTALVHEKFEGKKFFQQSLYPTMSGNLRRDAESINKMITDLLLLEYKFEKEFEENVLNSIQEVTAQLRNIMLEIDMLESDIEVEESDMPLPIPEKLDRNAIKYMRIFKALNTINIKLKLFKL